MLPFKGILKQATLRSNPSDSKRIAVKKLEGTNRVKINNWRLVVKTKFCAILLWYIRAAVIAPWFCLCLPSCGPRFESQAHLLCFFQFILLQLKLYYIGTKINGLAHI